MTAGRPRPDLALHLLGATIRHYRKERGITQKRLAHSIHVSPKYLREMERGERNVSIGVVLYLASALEVPLLTLLQPLAVHPELYPLPSEAPEQPL